MVQHNKVIWFGSSAPNQDITGHRGCARKQTSGPYLDQAKTLPVYQSLLLLVNSTSTKPVAPKNVF